jgi:hypothetical protein
MIDWIHEGTPYIICYHVCTIHDTQNGNCDLRMLSYAHVANMSLALRKGIANSPAQLADFNANEVKPVRNDGDQ